MAPFVMLCLRRVAIRALPLPSTPIAARMRPITTLTSSVTHLNKQPQFVSPLQRRFASEDANHGENATSEEAIKSADEEDGSSLAASLQSAPGTLFDKAADTANSVSESFGGVAEAAKPTWSAEAVAEARTVFIGNLYFQLREEDLAKPFERIGTVKSVKIITGPGGQSRGFGYVEFEDPAAAQRAVEECHLQNLEGRQMNVQIQKPRFLSAPKYPRDQNGPSKTLFIGNMPFDMSDRDLNNLFSKIKNLVDVRVAIDRRTGQPRGFAHADFVDVDSAAKGMEILRDIQVSGRMLRVDFSATVNRAGPPPAP